MIDCIIGVDPGASGGIAVLHKNAKTQVYHMPREIDDLKELFKYYSETFETLAFIEKLSLRPDDVLVQGDGANMGKLYRVQKMMSNFEQLKIAAAFCNLSYCLVHPLKWQSTLNLRLKDKEEKSARKRRYAQIASNLYPSVNVRLWNADALLIAHFGRYMLQYNRAWIMQNLPVREKNHYSGKKLAK